MSEPVPCYRVMEPMTIRKDAKARRWSPAHSVTFTPELKAAVERYAKARNLAFGAAVRALVTEQLRELKELDRFRRAREWQIVQGWSEATAIARGDVDEVDWDEIELVHRRALDRSGARERQASAR